MRSEPKMGTPASEPFHRGDKIQGCWREATKSKTTSPSKTKSAGGGNSGAAASGQVQQSWGSAVMISFPSSYIFFSPCHHLLQHPYSVTQTDRGGINFTLQVFAGEMIFSPGTRS